MHEPPRPYSARPVTGEMLRESHGLDWVAKAYYHKDSTFYERPRAYPAAFFDTGGYLLFTTESQLIDSPYSKVSARKVNFSPGIFSAPNYVRCGHSHLPD